MGGRGARSGLEKDSQGNIIPYGSTYKSVAELGDNIKIIVGRLESLNKNSTPMESQTPNRIYGVLTPSGKRLKSIVFINQNGKRKTQIDFLHTHKNVDKPHKHKGYVHTEQGFGSKRTFSKKERRVIKKIYKYAQNNGIMIK